MIFVPAVTVVRTAVNPHRGRKPTGAGSTATVSVVRTAVNPHRGRKHIGELGFVGGRFGQNGRESSSGTETFGFIRRV